MELELTATQAKQLGSLIHLTDSKFPLLDAVKVVLSPNQLKAYATDRFGLARLTLPSDNPSEGETTFYLGQPALKALAGVKLTKGGHYVKLTITDEGVSVLVDSSSVFTPKREQNYPPLETMISEHKPATVPHPQALKSALLAKLDKFHTINDDAWIMTLGEMNMGKKPAPILFTHNNLTVLLQPSLIK